MTSTPPQSTPGVTTAAGNVHSDLGGHPTSQEVANHNGAAANIESAVQEAVLHEQVNYISRGSRSYLHYFSVC
jgi:hypothetical protein